MARLDRTLRKISLREFANISVIEMLDFCEGRREVIVVDDEGETAITDTLLLSFTWFGFILHRHFNEEPYRVSEIIDFSGKKGYSTFIDDRLLTKPLEEFMPVVMVTRDDPDVYDLVKQLNYVHQNLIHNYLSILGEVAVVSIRAIDVALVYDHPKVQEIKKNRKSNQMTTQDAMTEFDKILRNEPAFDKSLFVLLYRTKGLDKIQSYNLIIERGPVFDLNGRIMPFNIDDSYAEGISNPADSLADSKGGGFSLISNGSALQKSEYFHMNIHHVGSSVIGVRYGTDCGSTKGIIVKVRSPEFLKILQGAYYFKEDGSLELIWEETMKNIKIGSTIKIRSIAWCHYGSTGKPCSVCYGKMISSLPYNRLTKRPSIPGLFYGSVFGEKTGQSILKTKHRIGNTHTAKFEIEPAGKGYLTTDGTFICFDENFINENKEPYIVLEDRLYKSLSDLSKVEDLDSINEVQIPTQADIQLSAKVKHPMFNDKFAVENKVLKASVASRRSRMTKPFINFLKSKEVVEGAKGKAKAISLLGWDFEQPAYELLNVNEDLNSYRNRAEKFLTFSHLKFKENEEVTEELHGEQFYDYWLLIREQNQDANKIIYDILLWSCMAKNPNKLDYSLPSANDPRYFRKLRDCFTNRGQVCPLMHGYQNKQLKGNPSQYVVKNRQPTALECFLLPLTYM